MVIQVYTLTSNAEEAEDPDLLSVHQGEVGAAEHPTPPAPRAELGVGTDTLPSQLCSLIAPSLES